jgi:hypothetical protein
LLFVGCGDDDESASNQPPQDVSSTTTSITNPESESTVPSGKAASLAQQLECEDPHQGVDDTPEGVPKPRQVVDCNLGDALVSIREYASKDEVTAVMESIKDDCGFRTVGEDWIVVVNSLETARAVQAKLGGETVTLAGCE